ncbi:multidrug effflux MFS transporter [Aureimonas leprariae]|uniref:Bcr/CflA family efflux transporter n=1 Tax=Plantimonas leprariae TaxID=2615207 RepID=A0A7V7PR36_9HYPH|nr:multidrug effflux MFS transporter [Aureimonas leprariae]KAB0680872.1 multidrug effflux MFS transporter [Aureimonas leprariae]
MSEAARPSAAQRLPYWELVTMIASLMALNAAAIDILIPALQQIGATLGVETENQRQLAISSYVFGFGAAQIVYGPLSDRFGRRPLLFVGLAIYILASFAAARSPTFEALLVARCIQGIGAAATRVIAVSIVRDCFGGARMASVMSLVMMVFMAVPIIAPNIGNAIMIFGSWQEIFIVNCVFATFVTLWVAARLPETLHPEDKRPLTPRKTAEAFRIVLTNRRSLGYSIAAALLFGVLFGFINQAEQVYTGIFKIGPLFTLYFSTAAFFMAAASFTNSRLVERFGMRRLSHGALCGFIALSAIQLLISGVLGFMPFWLFLPLVILTFGLFGFIGTNFNALALDPLGHVAGTASSVIGFMQTLLGGALGALIGACYDGTLRPLYAGFLLLSLSALVGVLLAERGRMFDRPGEVHLHLPEAEAQTPAE